MILLVKYATSSINMIINIYVPIVVQRWLRNKKKSLIITVECNLELCYENCTDIQP